MTPDPISALSPDEARLLDRLTLGGGPAATTAAASGVRRSRARGFDLEFHEYRHYEPGDDPRSIDWSVEARLHQLVVRVSRAQGHVPLHVLVDVSASMRIGTPAKLACARKMAAALCYVAIARRDAAGVSTFADDVLSYVRPAHGRPQLFRLFDALSVAAATGPSAIDRALERYAAIARGPGLVAILSDFFGSAPGLPGVRALLARGLMPALVQILAPEETAPDITGLTELVDVERDDEPPVIVDERAVAAYHARMAGHSASLRSTCLAAGLPYLQVPSDTGFKPLLSALEGAGLFGPP
jgi:uncharacterized protein (DUF58 family)